MEKDETFDKLYEQLLLEKWPSVYLFKFIVPNSKESVEEVKSLFRQDALLSTQESKTGKFVSVGAKQKMKSAKDVIAVYHEAAKVKGIISL